MSLSSVTGNEQALTFVFSVSCPELQFPDSGMVEIQTDGVTSMAIFSCLSGYYLHGENTLTCRTDGTWDNTDPICST